MGMICNPFLAVCAPLLLSVSILRAQSPGAFDTSFNATGRVTSTFGFATVTGNCLAVQPDGKIVVAGVLPGFNVEADFAVRRYLSDGTLDPTFGAGGSVVVDIAGQNDYATALALQLDGKIVVAGYSTPGTGNPTNYDFSLMRLNANGALDTTFNGTGKISQSVGPLEDRAYGVAVDGNNNVIVIGYTATGPDDSDIALLRFTPGGQLDSGFGNAGRVITAIGRSYDAANDIALQEDGRIVVAGLSRDPSSQCDRFAVLRYNGDGTLDTSFNSTGIAVNHQDGFCEEARSVAIQGDGKIVVGGSSSKTVLARYLPNGELDRAFGGTGFVRSLLSLNSWEAVTSVAVQSDGKIIAGGYFARGSNLHGSIIARFDSDGIQDNSFGVDGYVTGIHGEALYVSSGLALQKDGRIVSAGGSFGQGPDRFMVSRNWAFPAYESWRLKHFGVSGNSGAAADSFDADHDGLVNLLEYAFGLDPLSGSSNQLPEGQISGDEYVVQFTQATDVIGVTYAAEWSETLNAENWTPIPESGIFPNHEFRVLRGGRPRIFVRLKVHSS